MQNNYCFSVQIPRSIINTKELVLDALKAEQFGLISEIDMSAKLKEKLSIKHEPHIILGACNPQLAYTALQGNIDVALALPCNVVLHELEGITTVTALLPSVALKPFEGIKVQESACTAEESLSRVFSALQQHA